MRPYIGNTIDFLCVSTIELEIFQRLASVHDVREERSRREVFVVRFMGATRVL